MLDIECSSISTVRALLDNKRVTSIHISFISPLIESLYFICALKNVVGSRSFVRGIASPTEPHCSSKLHLAYAISHGSGEFAPRMIRILLGVLFKTDMIITHNGPKILVLL